MIKLQNYNCCFFFWSPKINSYAYFRKPNKIPTRVTENRAMVNNNVMSVNIFETSSKNLQLTCLINLCLKTCRNDIIWRCNAYCAHVSSICVFIWITHLVPKENETTYWIPITPSVYKKNLRNLYLETKAPNRE